MRLASLRLSTRATMLASSATIGMTATSPLPTMRARHRASTISSLPASSGAFQPMAGAMRVMLTKMSLPRPSAFFQRAARARERVPTIVSLPAPLSFLGGATTPLPTSHHLSTPRHPVGSLETMISIDGLTRPGASLNQPAGQRSSDTHLAAARGLISRIQPASHDLRVNHSSAARRLDAMQCAVGHDTADIHHERAHSYRRGRGR